MKKGILLFALAAAPLLAWANCPDLAGRYSCRYMGFSTNVVIAQSVRGGTTIYQVDAGGEIIADGIRHQTPNLHPILDRHARNYSYIATCGGDRLQFEGTADLVRGGQGDVDGELVKTGPTNVSIDLHLTTPTNNMDVNLACRR